jgi:hypothetical protein
MHHSLESLAVSNTLGIHASLMDNYHNTSLRFILEDDFISLASRTHICFCLSKGGRVMVGY